MASVVTVSQTERSVALFYKNKIWGSEVNPPHNLDSPQPQHNTVKSTEHILVWCSLVFWFGDKFYSSFAVDEGASLPEKTGWFHAFHSVFLTQPQFWRSQNFLNSWIKQKVKISWYDSVKIIISWACENRFKSTQFVLACTNSKLNSTHKSTHSRNPLAPVNLRLTDTKRISFSFSDESTFQILSENPWSHVYRGHPPYGSV